VAVAVAAAVVAAAVSYLLVVVHAPSLYIPLKNFSTSA
jgi:hypothetical protein